MQHIHKTALVNYSQQQMFQLVDDIAQYPDFIHWCHQALEHQRTPDAVHGTLSLAYGGIYKSFTTHNQLYPYERIELTLVEGPFKHLSGRWDFLETDGGNCLVTLDLQFEFANSWMKFVATPVFKGLMDSLVESFCRRAERVYRTAADHCKE